ncbi:hypothetical protein Pcinc_011776 [Petrolisthes cinctipes]|uniref:Uncharacterized protein n=1 Tax=Petrolisthes cinctipes TaxID=88211 RepID=A0AAE1G2E2_PETCI|nr:hypothetical protein Pcinc_011776 [Petrolisthes cinctipes]
MHHNIERLGKVSAKKNINGSKSMGPPKKVGRQQKQQQEDNKTLYAFSSLNILWMHGKLSRLSQCSNHNNAKLAALYDNRCKEQQIDGVSDVTTREDVRVPFRKGGEVNEEDYTTIKGLWLCNSGIHPRDQAEMFKKLVFSNYNKIWLRMFEEAINVFRKWVVLKSSTIDEPYFSVKYTNMPAQVIDNNPPNDVLHSKFLSKPDLVARISATNPLMKLKDLYVQSMAMSKSERFRNMSNPLNSVDPDLLDRAILCREYMTSMYDSRGSFITSKFTNSATLVFTPGTSVEGVDYAVADSPQRMLITSSKFLNGSGCNRVLRIYDNDLVMMNRRGGGSVNVIDLTGNTHKPEYVFKKAARDTVKDCNHTTTVKYSVYGHLTSSYSVLNSNYNARNMLMEMRRADREANSAADNAAANAVMNRAGDMSLRYIMGRLRGYVFYGDEFPPDANTTHLNALKQCFADLGDRKETTTTILNVDWLAISMVPEITRHNRFSARVRSCIKIDKRIVLGAKLTFNELVVSKSKRKAPTKRTHLSALDTRTGNEIRGVSFLANPVVSIKWLLTRAHHLRLASTNCGVASLSNFMGNRENKRALEDLPPASRGLATSFKMKTSRNSCISVDNNRFFLIGGTHLLGGRLEGVNLITDMFVRCKLHTEKLIVHGAMFDPNTTAAFLASCMEGTAVTRGLPMIEHISRLVNVTSNDASAKNYWSVGKDSGDEFTLPPSTTRDTTGVMKPPSVCVYDENYVFLSMIHSIVETMIKKKNKDSVETHLSKALSKSYTEVLDQRTGMPNMHALYHFKSIMNFCGYVNGICTGDGVKAHHLLHTLSAVGLNMTPKMAVCLIGVLGNNLKSSLVNVVKTGWWDKHADLGVEALVGNGDASSTDAKLAYVAGKMMIYILEEIGYQGGSVKDSKKGDEGVLQATTHNEDKLDAIHTRNIEIASNQWDKSSKRLKDNNIRVCELQTGNILGEDDDDDEEEGEEEENKRKRHAEDEKEDDQAVSSSCHHYPVVINYISDRVGWWNHIKGPVFAKINREKILSSIFSNSEMSFCTSSPKILDDSPWVRDTDLALSKADKIKNEFSEMSFIPPMNDDEEELPSSSPTTHSYSKIKEDCMDLIKKNPETKSFKPFKEALNLMKDLCIDADKEWTADENRGVLTKRCRPSKSDNSTSVIYAMHAYNPSSVSTSSLTKKNFRKRFVANSAVASQEDIGPILSRPRKSSKVLFCGGDDDTAQLIIKQTVEQTIAQVLNIPRKFGFPMLSIDGIEIFNINKSMDKVLIKASKAGSNNVRAGALQREIATLFNENNENNNGKVTTTTTCSPVRNELSSSFFNAFVTDRPPNWEGGGPVNNRERALLAAIDGNAKTNTFIESNLASCKMNKDSPLTKEMLPGQVSSNKLKQIASTDSMMSVRGLHGRPFTCSAAATPIMISNSYLLKFFVDTAMYKRMLIFPLETNFAAKNIEPNVDLGDKIIKTGMKVVHGLLLAKRADKWNNNNNRRQQHYDRLARRVEGWNTLMNTGYKASDADKLVSMFPSVFLKHIMQHKVLELSDNSNMIKLEEASNTFFQAHASTVMLAARSNALIEAGGDGEEEDDDSASGAHKQLCIINPKNMDTLQMCIDRAKTRGVWGLVNSAMRPVVFVDLPFVVTDAAYGEGSTLKMRVLEHSTTINTSFGIRMPDVDGGNIIKGGKPGTIGVGDALMKQLVWSWGSMNVKNVMYSCHQLHMLFELVVQEINSNKKLYNVGDMSSDYMSNVAFMLICSIYINMFDRFGDVLDGDCSSRRRSTKKRRLNEKVGGREQQKEEEGEFPMFMAMVVNKNIKHLNNMTNLADAKEKNRCHTQCIRQTMNVLDRKLNPKYLCNECKNLACK